MSLRCFLASRWFLVPMKKTMRWSDEKDESSSDESSSDSEAKESNHSPGRSKSRKIQHGESAKPSDVKSTKKKSGGIDFEALTRHGYKGGLTILNVPAPKVEEKRDWSWSNGKDKAATDKDTEESYRERQKLREIVADAELQAADAVARKEKAISFAQKEKRKRDLGQASRGKNYVEEEKRLLRESGVYSGFDS